MAVKCCVQVYKVKLIFPHWLLLFMFDYGEDLAAEWTGSRCIMGNKCPTNHWTFSGLQEHEYSRDLNKFLNIIKLIIELKGQQLMKSILEIRRNVCGMGHKLYQCLAIFLFFSHFLFKNRIKWGHQFQTLSSIYNSYLWKIF